MMPGADSLRTLSGILLAAMLSAGCGPANWNDGDLDRPPPPGSGPDPGSVDNPVPRNEPRSRYGNPESYEVFGRTYRVMNSSEGYVERGTASWYGTKFHGRRTSSGEPYDMHAMTAAHKLEMTDSGTAPVEVRALTTNHDDSAPAPERFRTAAEENNGRLYVQFGAFGSRDNARNLREALRSEGVRNVTVRRASTPAGRLYRVRAGPVSDPGEAERLGRISEQLGLPNAQVITD